MKEIYAKQDASEWWAYGRDTFNNRFTPLAQIDRNNFKHLTLVASWSLPCNDVPMGSFPNKQFGPNEGTPLKVGKFLYSVTAASQVAKFDLENLAPAMDKQGNTILYDPLIYKNRAASQIGFVHRGLIYWQDERGENGRLFLTQGDAQLVALDAESLRPIETFGVGGFVSLHKHRSPSGASLRYSVTSPPVVCNGVVVVGCAIPDLLRDNRAPKGSVQAFDSITGEPCWSFNTIPSNEEMRILGLDPDAQWQNNSNATTGQANVWSIMSADETLGMVYLPVGSGSNDSYGGHRLGNNVFSQSLVALDAKTGKIRWFQQLVRHGLWDYDVPAAPSLVDIEVDGRIEKLVVQVTKQAFAYVFNREDGTPRWNIVEASVPPSKVPGEIVSPTQPVPVLPLPFDQQGVYFEVGQDLLGRQVEANVLDFTPALKAKSIQVLQQYTCGPLFTPPTVMGEETMGTLQLPGFVGGASWAGGVFNRETGQFFVSSVTDPFINAVEDTSTTSNYNYMLVNPFYWRPKDPDNINLTYPLPLFKPPWGRITAIDLDTGDTAWPEPRAVGRGPRELLERFLGVGSIPSGDLGWSLRTHLLATPTLLVASQEANRFAYGYSDSNYDTLMYSLQPEDPMHRTLNAYDPATGELIDKIYVPTQAQGALMSFEFDGMQYIAYPAGGYNLNAQVLLFRLPISNQGEE